MSDGNDRSRCPECGSVVRGNERHCGVCGQALPFRMSLPSTALQSALVVVLVIVGGLGLQWMRSAGRGPWTDQPAALPDLLAEAPTAMPTSTPKLTPTPSVPPNTPRPATATPMPETVTHVVASGDTLYGIAGQYGVDPDNIIDINQLERPDALSIGQQLLIPMSLPPRDDAGDAEDDAVADSGAADGAADGEDALAEGGDRQQPAAPAGEPIVISEAEAHSVVSGDTLLGIAQQYGMSLEELLTLNADRLDGPGASLQVGDSIIVQAAVVVTSTPAPRATALTAPVGDAIGAQPAVPELPEGEVLFPSPLALAPLGGVVVTGEAPLLRWTSVGLLPDDVFYVVSVRESGDAEGEVWREWITSHATAVRVPSRFRPALGSTRDVEWSVAVRRRGDALVVGDEGTAVGVATPWQTFTWSPGQDDETDETP